MTKTWKFHDFQMPQVWNHEDEIYSLLQTFKRPRDIDPTAYDYKVNFWSNLILKFCHHHHIIVITEKYIQNIFTKEFTSNGISQKMMCARTIFDNLLSDNKIKDARQCSSSGIVNQLVKGLGSLVIKPVSWTYRSIYKYYSGDTEDPHDPEKEFVLPDVLQSVMKRFMSHALTQEQFFITSQMSVIDKADFDRLLEECVPDASSRSLVLGTLIIGGEVQVTRLDNGLDIVRLRPGSRDLSGAESSMLAGLANLRVQTRAMTARAEKLEMRLVQVKTATRTMLAESRKEEARRQFGLGKRLEKELARVRSVLANLESVSMEVEAARDSGEVLQGMAGATAALRAQTVGLDRAKDTVAELEDVLADLDEINTSIAGVGDSSAAAGSDTDLEAELDQMMQEEAASLRLPEVPNYEPISEPIPNSQPIRTQTPRSSLVDNQ